MNLFDKVLDILTIILAIRTESTDEDETVILSQSFSSGHSEGNGKSQILMRNVCGDTNIERPPGNY